MIKKTSEELNEKFVERMRSLKNSKPKPSEHTPQAIGYINKQQPSS